MTRKKNVKPATSLPTEEALKNAELDMTMVVENILQANLSPDDFEIIKAWLLQVSAIAHANLQIGIFTEFRQDLLKLSFLNR